MKLTNEEFFEILMLEIKNPNNLPLKIPRTLCPQNKKTCKKSHMDLEIVEMDSEGNYLFRDYPMHSDDFVDGWFSEKNLLAFLLKEARRYNLRDNIHLKDPNHIREHVSHVTYTKEEHEKLKSEADKKKTKVVDLIREKSLI